MFERRKEERFQLPIYQRSTDKASLGLKEEINQAARWFVCFSVCLFIYLFTFYNILRVSCFVCS